MKQQLLFWQNKELRMIFLGGAAIFLIGCGLALYNQIATSGWKEVRSYARVSSALSCSKGQSFTYQYEVEGKQYSASTCSTTTPSNSIVRYDPSNPERSDLNTFEMHQFAWITLAIFGAVSMLGTVFTTNPKSGTK